jgi:hypothetical protein
MNAPNAGKTVFAQHQPPHFPCLPAWKNSISPPLADWNAVGSRTLGQCSWITARHKYDRSRSDRFRKILFDLCLRHRRCPQWLHGSLPPHLAPASHPLRRSETMAPSPALLRSLARVKLLILDDWMRDPITIQNAQDILEVLDDRFGHTATLIASQVPIADWHRRIPDPTLGRCPSGSHCLQRSAHPTARRVSTKTQICPFHAEHGLNNLVKSEQ